MGFGTTSKAPPSATVRAAHTQFMNSALKKSKPLIAVADRADELAQINAVLEATGNPNRPDPLQRGFENQRKIKENAKSVDAKMAARRAAREELAARLEARPTEIEGVRVADGHRPHLDADTGPRLRLVTTE